MGNNFHLHDPARPRSCKPFSPTAALGEVYVSLRRIFSAFGSPNHWAVIIEVPGHGYINVQFNTTNETSTGLSTSSNCSSDSDSSHGGCGVKVSYHPTFDDAMLATDGANICDIRSSRYGSATKIKRVQALEEHVRELRANRFSKYTLLFTDCQDFSRELVKMLNGKFVGFLPSEDGPTTNYH